MGYYQWRGKDVLRGLWVFWDGWMLIQFSRKIIVTSLTLKIIKMI